MSISGPGASSRRPDDARGRGNAKPTRPRRQPLKIHAPKLPDVLGRLRGPKWQPPAPESEPTVNLDDELDEDTLVLQRRRAAATAEAAERRGATLIPNPELARVARRRVRLTVVAAFIAGLGAALMFTASVLRADDHLNAQLGMDRVWPSLANVGAVMVLLVCLLQWRVWTAAWLEWRGVRSARLSPWLGLSSLGGWLAVVMLVVESFAAWRATLLPSIGDQAWLLTWLGIAASFVAVVCGALRGFSPDDGQWAQPSSVDPGADTETFTARD